MKSILNPRHIGFALAAVLLSSLHAQLVNPGFETGTLSGWTVSSGGRATVVGTVTDYPSDPFTLDDDLSRPYTVAPFAGSYQARLVAGTTPLANLATFLSLPTSLLSNPTTNPFGIADGTALAQTVTLGKGDSILLNWNFLAVDPSFDDFAFASFVGPSGTSFTRLSSVFTLSGGLGTGWQTLTYVAPTAGSYRVGFGVANSDDNTVNSIVYADLSFRPVPEPATYGFLGALGLLALISVRRFRRDASQR